MANPDRRQRTALLLRLMGALFLTIGGLALVLVSLPWGRTSGMDARDFWTGVVGIVAGVLFGLPVLLSRR
jgi:hypothetical protein